MRMELFSPAKINLGLSIVGRRTDGFHLLESLFWPLNFGDSIEISNGDGRVRTQWDPMAPLQLTSPPAQSENIVTKVLGSISGFQNDLDITIFKKIPMGGGLGGGSSNAGTVLKHLLERRLVKIPEAEHWACQFGADIPFFLQNQPAWVTGVGEAVKPLEIDTVLLENLYFLLIIFPFGCETKKIFSSYKQDSCSFSNSVNPFPNGNITFLELVSFLKTANNDLEPIVSKLYPDIGKVLSKLAQQKCLYSGLSGSGSTCIAVFDSFEQREKTSQDLQSFFRINNCKSISAETFTTR